MTDNVDTVESIEDDETIISDSLGESLGNGLKDGVYTCTTAAKLVRSKKPSRKVPVHPRTGNARNGVFFTISYAITDPNSKYYGDDSLTDWFEIFPDITAEDYDLLDPDEKKGVRNQLKARTNRFRSLGVPEANLNTFSERGLSDIAVKVTVMSSKSDDGNRTFFNIKSVTLNTEVTDNVVSFT